MSSLSRLGASTAQKPARNVSARMRAPRDRARQVDQRRSRSLQLTRASPSGQAKRAPAKAAQAMADAGQAGVDRERGPYTPATMSQEEPSRRSGITGALLARSYTQLGGFDARVGMQPMHGVRCRPAADRTANPARYDVLTAASRRRNVEA